MVVGTYRSIDGIGGIVACVWNSVVFLSCEVRRRVEYTSNTFFIHMMMNSTSSGISSSRRGIAAGRCILRRDAARRFRGRERCFCRLIVASLEALARQLVFTL